MRRILILRSTPTVGVTERHVADYAAYLLLTIKNHIQFG